jgi:hypothetical protein
MTHEHASEYRVRIVHADETEQLGGWMSCQQVAQAIAELRESPPKAYWLQVRNILCPNCPQREQTIVEFRLTLTTGANNRFPRQTERRLFGSQSSRASSAGA